MKQRLFLFALLFIGSGLFNVAHAQTTVTWSEHIAPILINKCASCHRREPWHRLNC